MKRIKFKYQIIIIGILLGLTSCSDWFDLHPQSETILEDYWKDENDVLSMVGSCYRGMTEISFMERLIVWGEVRSDDVLKGMNSNEDLDHFLTLTLNANNSYTSWSDFYKVINYCNTVIYYAPEVRKKDPNFTEGQLRAYIAEVKGIRALCYFTLVRTFRDIPFITEPVMDDSKSFEVPQSDPNVIIDYLIDDLKSVENNAITSYDKKAYDKGRITRKAIWALIADMALWRNDYETCITYCDKVTTQTPSLVLDKSLSFSKNIFSLALSDETIFELQFNTSLPNYTANEMYSIYGGGRSGQNTFKLSSFDFLNQSNLFGSTDLRAKDYFMPIESDGYFPIMKYVGYRVRENSGTVSRSDYTASNSYSWIFYRLPDIYLMKAEALVEKGELEPAFEMVTKTYDRANPELGTGSLQFDSYNSQALMRNLVFDERQREFLFEGKRYFDLLRRINREGTPANVVNTYLIRKYKSLDQATVQSKVSDLDALYMPINYNELKLNPLLVQNPFYVLSDEISKN